MSNTTQLREKLDALQYPVFVVLDGAQFDDLPSELLDGDFIHKPLYVDRGGKAARGADFERTAPHLVWLNESDQSDTPRPQADVMNALLELVGDRPAAVFWECPAGGDALYKHLRSINMVMIPKEDESSVDQPENEDGEFTESAEISHEKDPAEEVDNDTLDSNQDGDHDLVTFRHADANVLAQVLPALDEVKCSRLLGPAQTLVCAPTSTWSIDGPLIWQKKPLSGSVANGPLVFEPEDIEGIEENRSSGNRREVMEYLREYLDDEVDQMDDSELYRSVVSAEHHANSLGVQSTKSHLLFAWLVHAAGYGFIDAAKFKSACETHSISPDKAVEVLFDGFVEAAESQENG